MTIHEELVKLNKERVRLEKELAKPGAMVAGAIIQRYTVCGKEGCRCLKGDRHGPYPALSRPNGQVVYLNRKLHIKISPLVERYQVFQRDLANWRRLQKKCDELYGKLRTERLIEFEKVKSKLNS